MERRAFPLRSQVRSAVSQSDRQARLKEGCRSSSREWSQDFIIQLTGGLGHVTLYNRFVR